MSLDCHRGVEWMVLRYNLPMPEGLLGAQKTAAAEWNTWIFVALIVVGQQVRGGGSVECLILFIEEEVPDKLIEVCLTYVFTECLE